MTLRKNKLECWSEVIALHTCPIFVRYKCRLLMGAGIDKVGRLDQADRPTSRAGRAKRCAPFNCQYFLGGILKLTRHWHYASLISLFIICLQVLYPLPTCWVWMKIIIGTNTLAYLSCASVRKGKSFVLLTLGPNAVILFTSVINKCLLYGSVCPWQVLYLWVRPGAYPTVEYHKGASLV